MLRVAGTNCGSNGLKCASGVCTSRDAQCASSGSSLGLSKACPASQVSTISKPLILSPLAGANRFRILQSTSCSIACLSAESSTQCVVLQQSFRDGSPCGCEPRPSFRSWPSTGAADIFCLRRRRDLRLGQLPLRLGPRHRQKLVPRQSAQCVPLLPHSSPIHPLTPSPPSCLAVSIPVTIVAALVVLALAWCLFSCCCRRAKAPKAAPSGAYIVPAAAGRGNRLGRRNRLRSGPTPPAGPAPVQQQQGDWWQGQQGDGYGQHAPSLHQPEMAYNGAGVGAGGRRMPPPPPSQGQGQWGGQGQQGGGWVVSQGLWSGRFPRMSCADSSPLFICRTRRRTTGRTTGTTSRRGGVAWRGVARV